MAILRERHREGQTMVLVTHDLRIASAADRVISMRDGRIAGETVIGDADRTEDPLARVVTVDG
jgi:putative ABC transport system ATP-binding protein